MTEEISESRLTLDEACGVSQHRHRDRRQLMLLHAQMAMQPAQQADPAAVAMMVATSMLVRLLAKPVHEEVQTTDIGAQHPQSTRCFTSTVNPVVQVDACATHREISYPRSTEDPVKMGLW